MSTLLGVLLVAVATWRRDGGSGDEGRGGAWACRVVATIALICSVLKAIRLREEIVLMLWLTIVRHLVSKMQREWMLDRFRI
jgi:hypothetical protein